MKRLICSVFALSLIGGTTAMADDHDHDHNNNNDYTHHDDSHHHDRVHWNKGDHISGHYVVVDDWSHHHLRRPPRGYHWVRTDDGDYILAAVTTGVILDLMLNGH